VLRRNELVLAVRRLSKARTFSTVAVLTVALGAGALGTVYSVAKTLFIDPLPYPDAQRIVVVSGEMRQADVQEWPVGVLDLRDVRAGQEVLLGPVPVAGGRGFSVLLNDVVEHVVGEMVGADYFTIFGVTPALGRFFTADEERLPLATAVVLSHELWQRHFNGAQNVIGRTLLLNEHSVEVIGVAPAGFKGLDDEALLWLPVGSAAALYQPGYLEVREFRWLAGVAQLRNGATLDIAAAEVESAMRALETQFPREYAGFHLKLDPLATYLFGDLRQPVWIMFAAALLVLAIACTNLASLLLVRGLARRRETGLRLALGAGVRHIVGGIVAELTIIVLLGGALGLMLASSILPLLVGGAGIDLPSFALPRVDAGVAALTVVFCFATSLLFGLLPAWLSGRVSPGAVLKESGNATTGGTARRRLQATLVVLETALAILLLLGTGLLLRGLDAYMRTDLGFHAEDVTAMRLNMASQRYLENATYAAFAQDLLNRVAGVPDVAHGALEGPGYPTYGSYGLHFWNDNAPGGPVDVMTSRHHVSADYFATLGIPLVSGRDFTTADQGGGGNVIIVDRALAETIWPGRDPVGRTLRTSRGTELNMTVIGVAENVRHQGLSATTFVAPNVYIPLLHFPPKSPAAMTLLVKSAGPASEVGASLRSALRAADPSIPIVEVQPLRAAVHEQTARNRLLTTLMAGFASLALILAGVGIYGVVAYSVEQSARELGIRMALGAGAASVLRHVLRRGLTPVAIGIACGLLGVPMVQRLVASQLHGTHPFDLLALAGALVTLLAIATAATLIPAARAARMDPLRTLKAE
jgi:predicted permease